MLPAASIRTLGSTRRSFDIPLAINSTGDHAPPMARRLAAIFIDNERVKLDAVTSPSSVANTTTASPSARIDKAGCKTLTPKVFGPRSAATGGDQSVPCRRLLHN